MPEGVDWAALVKNAMDTYSVEIAGGLGPTVGRVWRVGIMVRFSSSTAYTAYTHAPDMKLTSHCALDFLPEHACMCMSMLEHGREL